MSYLNTTELKLPIIASKIWINPFAITVSSANPTIFLSISVPIIKSVGVVIVIASVIEHRRLE